MLIHMTSPDDDNRILPMFLSQYYFQAIAAWEIKIVLFIEYNQMKDQEREAKGTTEFKGQYDHYTIFMKMETKDRLVIEVQDSISFNRWRKVIDGQFIEAQEDPFYASSFTEPETIFDYVSENFSEASFKPDMFSFIYSYGASKNKKTKIMSIPLEKEEINPTDLAHVRIDKMRKEFAEKLTNYVTIAKMEDLLIKLHQKMANMETEIKQLHICIVNEKENNRKLEETCREVQERLDKQEDMCKKLTERLKKQEETVKRQQERLEKEEERSKMIEQKQKRDEQRILVLQKFQKESNTTIVEHVQVLKERQKYCERFIDFRIITHHSNNPHSQYYALTDCTATSSKLTRTGEEDEQWYNFVNRTEVLSSQHNRYAVRILKATDSDLQIGFCTEKGLEVIDNYSEDESVYYYCSGDGRLDVNGVQKQLSGCGSGDGDVVEAVCDLLEGRVVWSKGGKLLAECAVPANMKGKPIYLSIILCYEGDAVEVTQLE